MIKIPDSTRSSFRKWRPFFTFLGLCLFFAGSYVSLRSAALDLEEFSLTPFFILMLVLVPVQILLSALSLVVSARFVGSTLGIPEGIKVSALATISELLPVPAGGIVRGTALVRSGAGIASSMQIILVSSLLTLLMCTEVASLYLYFSGHQLGAFLALFSVIGIVICLAWLFLLAGSVLTSSMFGLRLVIILTGMLRMVAAFGTIGYTLEFSSATLFVTATQLGNAIAIIPAGLGISELLATLFARLGSVPAEYAFIAVALNRVAGLFVNGAITLAWLLSSALWEKSR